jgi:hypothetical protein
MFRFIEFIPSTIVHNVTLKEFLKLKAECFDLYHVNELSHFINFLNYIISVAAVNVYDLYEIKTMKKLHFYFQLFYKDAYDWGYIAIARQ